MNAENRWPKRKTPRLTQYDYSRPGAYFVTLCTHEKRKILSDIVGAIHESPVVELSALGKIVARVIENFPSHLGVDIDRYVIMPNHIHMILTIVDSDGSRAIRESPLRVRSLISSAVGYIKMNASKEIHLVFGNMKIWQRSFHDHVIRNQKDYDMIAKYIVENPLRWQYDCFYGEESEKT